MAVPGLAVVGYAWWAVGLPPFSAAATVAVLSAGASAAVAGRRWKAARPAAARSGATWPWAVLAVIAAAWQLAAYLQHPRDAYPTVSSMTDALLDSRPARTAAFVLWLAGAAHLGRR